MVLRWFFSNKKGKYFSKIFQDNSPKFNKRCMFKVASTRIMFILVFVGILLLKLTISTTASSPTDHILGEKITIDLPKGDYKVKIITPSGTFIQKTTKSFAFKPEEIGLHKVMILGDKEESYEFNIIKDLPNKEIIRDKPKIKGNLSQQNINTSIFKESSNKSKEEIVIGKPVKNKKIVQINEPSGEVRLKIPEESDEISVSVNGLREEFKVERGMVERIKRIFSENTKKDIVINNVKGEVELSYTTPAPLKREKRLTGTRKEVEVFAPEVYEYKNVKSFTSISDIIPLEEKDKIKVYWRQEGIYLDFRVKDKDNNGLIDWVEWTVPHLSTQTFDIIIEIVSAEHLDQDRNFIRDIFDKVKKRDQIWAKIPQGDFVRVVFEKFLTSKNDITIYAKSLDKGNVEVYEKDSSKVLADFGGISNDKKYRIQLSELTNLQNTFDLKVLGGDMFFDYIFDPACSTEYNFTTNMHGIDDVGSWQVQVNNYRTVDDSQAKAGKDPEDTATANMYDFNFETDGSIGKLKMKDKANNDGQWLKIDTGLAPGQTMVGDIKIRVMGADLAGTACGGKETWTDFTNVIAYLYTNSSAINSSANVTETITNALINDGCTTSTNTCTVDAIELNLTDLYNQAPSGQNFTIRLIADGNFGNLEIKEIVEIYMQYEIYVESNPPNVTLISPANNSVDADGSVLFEYNVTDDSNITKCELIIDGGVDQTDTSVTENITQNFSASLADGLHNWSVNCTDDSGNANVGASQTRNINISLPSDTQSPNVTLISPPNASTDNSGNIEFVYNVTDNLAITNCSLIINGTINQTDTSITEDVNQSFNVAFPDGSYSWSVNCTDNSASSNEGNSSTRTISVSDTTAPGINQLSPVDSYNLTSSNSINFIYNVSDPNGLANCSLYINGAINQTDTTITNNANNSFTQSFADGVYNWSIGCYDGASSSNYGITGNRTFNITTPYCIASDFNFSSNGHPIDDVGSWAVKVTGWHTVADTSAVAGKDPEDTATTNMYDGDFETDGTAGKLKLKDKANNDGQWLKIDTGLSPGQAVIGDIILRVVGADLAGTACGGKETWTDFTNVIAYLYDTATTVDSGSSVTSTIASALINPGCTTPSNICTVDAVELNLTSLYNSAPSGQNFTIRLIADSGFGGLEIKEIVEMYLQYSLDTDVPTVNLVSPENNSVDTDGSVLFEYNVSDTSSINNCSLIIDGGVDQTDTTITKDTTQNFSASLADGLHNWSINCTDAGSQVGASETRNLNISLPPDTQSPNVTLISPPNASTDNDGSVEFIYNVTDNLAIASCSLIINGAINQTDTTITEDVNQSFTASLPDATYQWSVNCTDNSANANVGNSSTWQVTTSDTTAPGINQLSPVDSYNLTSSNSINFIYNVSDPNGLANCSLYINGAINQTDTTITNNANNSFTQSFADGVYNWSIGCYDGSSNLNFATTVNRTFNISTPYCIASDFNFSSNGHPINDVGSWAVKVTGWHTAADSQASVGKNPEDTATTNMYDGDFETDGAADKLKLKDKANNDGQWLKIDTGVSPNQILNGSMILRVVGTDWDGGACAGKETWTDFTNVIAYLYNASGTIDTNINATDTITNALINPGCTTPTSQCTTDGIEINITELYNNAPSDQNFTIRLIADSGFGGLEIKEIVEMYLQYQITPDTTAPNITLIAPANDTVDTDGSVLFQYNVTDDTAVSSCSLIIDDSIVENDTSITQSMTQNFTRIVSEGLHNWSVNCTDANSNIGASQTRILNVSLPVDTQSPNVTLISPANGSSDTDGYVTFEYNVTDNLAVISCSLIIDGGVDQTDTSITEDVTQNFTQSLRNGWHNWSVNCTDNSANANVGNSSTWQINISAPILTGRWWESSSSSYTSSASINLNQSRDGTQNDATFNIASKNLATLSTATSHYFGNNGILIGASSNVDLSGYFTAEVNNKGYVTWKLYSTNSTGDTLICQAGDDAKTTSTRLTSATGTFTDTCTASATATRLQSTDRLKLIVNLYNDDGNTRQYGHAWDNNLLSFVDINSFKTLGFLDIDLVEPLVDPTPGVNDLFNMTCQIKCDDGNCTNTNVYAQYNSGSGYSNISSTGSLILDTGVSNPQVAGEIDSTPVNYTFQIKANSISSNTVRCLATSDYSDSTGTTTTTVTVGGGANAPTVTLTNPSTGTAQNSSTITLYYNASDVDLNIANSTLVLNGALNQTNQTPILDSQINNFTITLDDGNYNWTVNVTDTTSLTGTDPSTRNFTIDTKAPQIILYNPIAGQSLGSSSVFFNFTQTDNLDSTLTCDLIIDSTVYENDFGASNNTLTNFTEVIGTGIHFWNVSCTDDTGTTNYSETRNFTVTDEPPTVALITANNSFSITGNINLSYNVSDNNGLINATLILNGANNLSNQSTILNNQTNNFSLTGLAEGVYTWDVNVTDTGSFTAINGTPRTFTVDKFAPNVDLNLPSDGLETNSSSLSFNFTATDSVDSSLTCNLSIGSYTDLNFQASNATLTNRPQTNLPDGSHLWNATCTDDAGNTNTSVSRTINITEYPTITLNTANNSFFNTSSINLTYTPSDNVNLSSCSLYLDGVFNQTNQTTINNGAENNFTITGIAQGTHNWTVYCNDTYGLQNNSETRIFTIDTNGLSVSLLAPPNGASIFTSDVNFSYNATDNLDPTLDCNITVNGIVVDNYTATSGAETNRTVNFATGGLKYWNVTCQDDSLNTVTSVTRNFNLAFAPTVDLTSPADNYATNSSIVNFYYIPHDDNDNLANSSLILDGAVNQTNSTPLSIDTSNNFTVTGLAEGTHTWNINVTDTTNLVGTNTTRTLTVDLTNPLLTINGPLQDEIVTDNNVTLNFTVTDNLDSNLTCNVSVDAFNEFENIGATNATDEVNYMLRNDGNYTWYVLCADDAGNFNQSTSINFSVVAPPIISLDDPTNNEYLNDTSITFLYTPNDSIGITQCSLYIDDIFNQTDNTINKNQQNSFGPVSGISEGKHNWTVNCTDSDANTAQPSPNIFYRDLSPPVIVLDEPTNNSNLDANAASVDFKWTATDALDNLLTCDLVVNGVTEVNDVLVTSGVQRTEPVSGLPTGISYWNVTCWDTINNINTSLTYQFNRTYPDFLVNDSSIVFNQSEPTENETITINATVYNLGNVNSSAVTVQFYNGDPNNGGTQIGSNQSITILAGGSNTTSETWQISLGSSEVFVIVDPPISSNGTYQELNESNNKVSKNLSVGGWHFFYGDINSDSKFVLENSNDSAVIRWNKSDLNKVNIYATDYDSSIEWSNIQAIGKNTSDQNSSNDFSEIDSILNMTNFSDSVSNLYLNGSSINETGFFIVFSSLIDEVPLTTSINTSVFKTGILWDVSDDTNGEYDSTEREDIIFVTNVSQDTPGSIEVTDYELRVPAKLREYVSGNQESAAFYIELI